MYIPALKASFNQLQEFYAEHQLIDVKMDEFF